MRRRSFLAGMGAGVAVSALDWFRYFKQAGVPGTPKQLGMAEAAAQAASDPHFLVYWNMEGGWNGYSMFNPLDTPNDAKTSFAAGTLSPTPAWSDQHYRPGPNGNATTVGNITSGYLAQGGASLFPDMAVISSHYGGEFHSGSRFEYHYGKTGVSLGATRQPDERTVMQAFAEQYGAAYLLPHISWHLWSSDGEVNLDSYPVGTGYYENLGPTYAHTIYGQTPAQMRARLSAIAALKGNARDTRIKAFVENLQNGLIMQDKNGASVQAFASAVAAYRALQNGTAAQAANPATMFTDATLRTEFGVATADENTSSTSVNGNQPRSKGSPNTNVQALMTYELMTKGLSTAFFLESREIRGFDDHISRQYILSDKGQIDQKNRIDQNLWNPLKALVNRLKTTPYPGKPGKSYWDFTNIVLCSEMGRTIQGDTSGISGDYNAIMDQDCCQHWNVSSAVLLGGNVKGNTQWGKVGAQTADAIPIMPDGTLDPAYDATTGHLKAGMQQNASSFITDAGHLYATALDVSGISPAGKGRNQRPSLSFIKKV